MIKTKRELIEALENFDDDMLIVVNGYEGGYQHIKHIKEIEVVEEKQEDSYCGNYSEVDENDYDYYSDEYKFKVVCLSRYI
jgi:hypothetical protein